MRCDARSWVLSCRVVSCLLAPPHPPGLLNLCSFFSAACWAGLRCFFSFELLACATRAFSGFLPLTFAFYGGGQRCCFWAGGTLMVVVSYRIVSYRIVAWRVVSLYNTHSHASIHCILRICISSYLTLLAHSPSDSQRSGLQTETVRAWVGRGDDNHLCLLRSPLQLIIHPTTSPRPSPSTPPPRTPRPSTPRAQFTASASSASQLQPSPP